jgi:iron complex outermembrane receptor protein
MPGNLTAAEMVADRTQSQPARTWFPPAWGGWAATSSAHTEDESENEYVNASILFEGSLGEAGDFEVNFLWGNKDITVDMPSWFDPGRFNRLDIDTFGITPRYILATKPFGFQNKFIIGLDLYHETLSIDQFLDKERSQQAWEAEAIKDSLGLYVRDEFSPIDQIILGIGYRIEWAEYEAEKKEILGGGGGTAFDTKKKTHKEDAFDVSLNWLIGDRSKIYSKYSKLYRFPFVDEQVSFYGWVDAFNDTLDPEKGNSYEIGADFYPIDNLNIGLSLFRIDLTDEILWNNTLNKNINLDETSHSGIEVYISYHIKELIDFWGKYDYHKSEFENGPFNGKELPFAPNHLVSAGMDITLPYDIHLCPEMVYVSDSYLGNDYDNSSEKLDGYTVFDLYIRFKPEWNRLKITAFFGVKNIFDEEYSTIGYENDPNDGSAPTNTFIPSIGREFVGGISFDF